MQTMRLKAKVNTDGTLNLQLPQELSDRELDLVIVYQLAESDKSSENIDDLHDVVDRFYGSLANDPILVEEQDRQAIA